MCEEVGLIMALTVAAAIGALSVSYTHLFLMISFMRSGDLKTVILAVASAVFGGAIILRFKPYIANRFEDVYKRQR